MDGKARTGQVGSVDRRMGPIWGAIDALEALEVESAWAERELGQEPEILRIRREGALDALCGICRRCMAEQLASDLGVTPGQALADILRDEQTALREKRCTIEDAILMAA